MASQNYEDYWKLTVEYTNIHGERFNGTLRIIIDFIDANIGIEFSSEMFSELQELVFQVYPKADDGSIRKSINQFVKLGFVNYHLESYHANAKEFLETEAIKQRKKQKNSKKNSLFSKIVYSNAKFNASVTEYHNWNQMNFLLKTLSEVGKLTKSDLIALMLVDIERVEKGYLNSDELHAYALEAEKIGFIERKYNQIDYLTNFLKKLDDIVFVNNELYFEKDARKIFGDEPKDDKKVRDQYLHRLYKNQLREESINILGDTKCMVEHLAYPVLIASHIKPFIQSDENEAYDANNGILLSRNLDCLFDLGYITFDEEGRVVTAEQLSDDLKPVVSQYTLAPEFLTAERRQYLSFHRKEVFEKKFRS